MRTKILVSLYLVGYMQLGAVFAEGNAMDVPMLQGRWMLESIDGQPVGTGHGVYFQIDGVTITGFDGCNNFGGSLTSPSQLRKTQRGCVSDGPRLPLQLSDPRPQLDAATLDGDLLTVPLPDGKGQAKFRRQ